MKQSTLKFANRYEESFKVLIQMKSEQVFDDFEREENLTRDQFKEAFVQLLSINSQKTIKYMLKTPNANDENLKKERVKTYSQLIEQIEGME